MAVFDEEIERKMDEMVERAARNAVAFYIEDTMDEFAAMRESHDLIMAKLDTFITRDEFNEAMGDIRLNRLALIETNKDLGKLDLRVTKLENA